MRLALAIVVIVACAPTSSGPGLDADRVLAHVEAQVAMGPRPGDTDRSRATLAWIERQLPVRGERMTVGTVELPEIRVLGHLNRAARTATTTDDNLVARFGPATGRALLVMAHYDTVAQGPGAVDNAAAVGVLIELAHVLAKQPPAQPVVLAFTANEEIGLVGAEALASKLADVGFAISLDLVGGSGPLVVNGASELIGEAELGWIADAAERAGVVVRVPPAHRVVSRWWPQSERSDHGPFTRRGIRALHLYHRGQDGELIDLAYHSPRDTRDRVQRTSVDELGRLLVALAAAPIPSPTRDGFVLPVVANVVVPRAALLAFELALGVLAGALLLRRRQHEARRRGLGLLAAIVCYALACAAAMTVEHVLSHGHPAPWLHAPLVAVIASGCLIGGLVMLLSRLGSRFSPWVGERRYLAVAAGLPLAIGGALLAIGAAELAWIWLVPAAVTAIASRAWPLRVVAAFVQLLPAVLVLAPAQLRETAWHGFLPLEIPLAVWVGAFGVAPVATVCWALRSRRAPAGPLGTLVLPVGSALVTIVGLALFVRGFDPCTPAQFHSFHLACEVVERVR